jgi:hypothetical protein
MDLWDDLDADPHELHNVHGQPGYESVQEALHRRLEALREQSGDTTGS